VLSKRNATTSRQPGRTSAELIMITTTILNTADRLVLQRTDTEVFNLGNIAPLSKRSKVLTIAITPTSTPTHRSLLGLRPLLPAQTHRIPINLVTFATTQHPLQHHRTHLVDLIFNVDLNFTLSTPSVTKIANYSSSLPILTKTPTTRQSPHLLRRLLNLLQRTHCLPCSSIQYRHDHSAHTPIHPGWLTIVPYSVLT